MTKPEDKAREDIDRQLMAAGWVVQDRREANLHAGRGIAVREFLLKPGHGSADYLLYVDGKAAGVVEAKPAGTTLKGIEPQSEKYSVGLPQNLPAWHRPLPFLYESTGTETQFTNRFDPEPRSRELFSFHRPETLVEWLAAKPLWFPLVAGQPDPRSLVPSTLRSRLRAMPVIDEKGLWPAQLKALRKLEASFYDDRPRSLIQMTMGSGKTFLAISAAYRLIKFADAKRVLFLVDRANLGRQALKEFQQFVTPDDGRKFTELYNVQFLTSNRLDPVARVVITTIQRLYSMLKGEPELDPTLEEGSQFDTGGGLIRSPVPVAYNPSIPIEYFDIAFVDECHRSIYSLWRQVVEYFDAHLVGLTATPSKQTFGFFQQNLVTEYSHEQAVADGVNVDFVIYQILTRITKLGSTVEAGPFETIGKRNRASRAVRWEKLDEDLTYGAAALDREVVAVDQIRTVIQTFKEKLFTEIFPGRREVPKTLIYAKDDSHADDIVRIVREEFGKGNDFCQKITYRTGTARIVTKTAGSDGREFEEVAYKSSGLKAEDLLSSFRNSYNPRIVVTVDMVATGTDIKPLEIVMFMRAVRSRNFFEQMKGRGVRVIPETDFQAVTPDARSKTGFVIVDCIGINEADLADTYPLDRKPYVSLDKLLQAMAFGTTEEEVLSSVASRLARIAGQLEPHNIAELQKLSGGQTLHEIAGRLVQSLDPDRQREEARRTAGLPEGAEPPPELVAGAAERLAKEAARPIAANPDFRRRLLEIQKTLEQTLDDQSKDEVLVAGQSEEAKERARSLVRSFEKFIEDNRDEIIALQLLYRSPHARRLQFQDIQALANAIEAPPRSWTPEVLWRSYETLDRDKVRGAAGVRLLTDIVSLVRFALHRDEVLAPFRDVVEERFETWLAGQESKGRRFSEEQRQWLALIRDHVAASLQIDMDDFDFTPFVQRGGAGKAAQVFGGDLASLLEDLNQIVAA